jgi:hypothetical protein
MSDNATPMLSIFDGRECIGFVLARGVAGYEAFDRDGRSLGLFATRRAAADALSNGGAA